MNTLNRVIALAVFGSLSHGSLAGDIYTCKSANGQKSFQNIPCARAQSELKHNSFDAADSRPPPAKPQANTQLGDPVQQTPVYGNEAQPRR